MLPIQITQTDQGKILGFPSYATAGASGMDLMAAIAEPLTIAPGQRLLVATGISIAMPMGVEAQIRPRSGLALKHGLTVLNTPGTIDSDYRGEIKVILINLGQEPFEITPAMRIAQMVFAEIVQVQLQPVDALSETVRHTGGFGSTGLQAAPQAESVKMLAETV
jgi:dUTP pyrophosphatase